MDIRGEDKIMSFIDKINQRKRDAEDFDSMSNSIDGKLRQIDRNKEDMRNTCINEILSNCYRKSLPLGDTYKDDHEDELKGDFSKFIITHRHPEGAIFYIKEAIRKGSPFAKKIMERVDKLVNDEFENKEINIDSLEPEQLVFKMTDDVHQKINDISDDLSIDEISDKIKSNVKDTAISEINRAKAEKQEMKKLEEELLNDPSMNSQTAVESALTLYDIKTERTGFYEPETIFMSMLIGNMNKLMNESYEGDTDYLKDALVLFKESDDEPTNYISEKAFIDSIRDYTCLNMIHTLGLEKFNGNQMMEFKYKFLK